MSNDFPILRYSDILLTKAEAQFRSGTGDPLSLVNQVIGRAGATQYTSVTADNLLTERGREFFYEGWRRQDLIRFGKYNDARQFKPASTPNKNIFPIPAQQINANPRLVQNPGY